MGRISDQDFEVIHAILKKEKTFKSATNKGTHITVAFTLAEDEPYFNTLEFTYSNALEFNYFVADRREFVFIIFPKSVEQFIRLNLESYVNKY